jgi:hypothetical protein
MRISFTGTRQGMSAWQKQQLEALLRHNYEHAALFAHGACRGADVEAHAIVRKVFGSDVYVAVYPSTAKTKAPLELYEDASFIAVPKAPLARDRDIVDAGRDLLIAAPLQMYEVQRSGTWSTVRYARKKKIRVEILWRF